MNDLWEKLQYFWYDVILLNLYEFWNWFWFYRKGKVKFRVFIIDDMYNVSAETKNRSVHNCYGTTLEIAKQIAMFRLNNRESRIIYGTIEDIKEGYPEQYNEQQRDEIKTK
ncbi:hypothetical protein [Cytobacillus gottheilii]|uniref:Uncharacterized protein n=1 Tax=Cytobacillus gottheilii TaxID=859144 RepID=A0ABX8F9V9_9BACI|nr:hypothetical protein [Cytobacillus gottheilii]QVY60915.1 hypothetical protein J1899_18370 [Cytobacillus gottheilii]